VIISSARRAVPAACAGAAALLGTIAALHYHRLGLTLSHYDARGHLVVARRIVDSITPGWQQIGAVWLPLPHLLNMFPVQVDAFYRSGASAVAISIVAFAAATGAIAAIVIALTGSHAAAVGAAAVFALNPNVLYLQSTPMTEPLLLALTTAGVALLIEFVARGSGRASIVGWVLALACLTRYEAWPVTASALVAAVWAFWRRREPLSIALRRVAAIALYPAIAIVGFLIFSRVVVGEWFVSGGFFVPENKALHDPVMAAAELWWGTHNLSGYLLVAIGAAGLGVLAAVGLFSRRHPEALIATALVATGSLPWLAFVQGHPFRIRYMVPLLAMEAVGAGAAAGALARLKPPKATVPTTMGQAAELAALALLCVVAYELRPLDHAAPMVVEAQWDRPNVPVRATVTQCLAGWREGEKIMASMGSLGHYMQEASRAGFQIRDFLHEGNGDIWLAALDHPYPFADWILIEEKAEGGDMLAQRAREWRYFLQGYTRVCEGAGVALYRRGLGNDSWGLERPIADSQIPIP